MDSVLSAGWERLRTLLYRTKASKPAQFSIICEAGVRLTDTCGRKVLLSERSSDKRTVMAHLELEGCRVFRDVFRGRERGSGFLRNHVPGGVSFAFPTHPPSPRTRRYPVRPKQQKIHPRRHALHPLQRADAQRSNVRRVKAAVEVSRPPRRIARFQPSPPLTRGCRPPVLRHNCGLPI